MTNIVKEHKIITDVKRHPNDVRYPCRTTHEILDASRKFLSILSNDERFMMLNGELVIDEEETAEFYDSILEKDVIGLGIIRENGAFSNMYIVDKIHQGDDFMDCTNMYSKEVEEISFQDISMGLSLNLCEILYRDDKPFGASDKSEYTIKIMVDEDDEEAVKNAEEIIKNLEEGLKEEEKSPDKTKFSDCYHAFGYKNDEYVVILKSIDDWENRNNGNNVKDDLSHLVKTLDINPLPELGVDVYEYDHKYSASELKGLFSSFGCEENVEMVELLK